MTYSNRTEALKACKGMYAQYLQPAKKRVQGKTSYICPLCNNGSGADGDGMSIDPHGDGTQLKCFKCGFYGDIVDLYQQQYSCDTSTAIAALYEQFDIRVEAARKATEPHDSARPINAQEKPTAAVQGHTEAIDRKPDYTAYYNRCKERLGEAAEYLTFRGISAETAARYWLGYDPAADPASAPGAMGNEYKPHACPRLIIPFDRSHYMGRRTDGGTEYKAMNSRKHNDSDNAPPFNLKALYNAAGRPVFITEGAIDALSIIEAGGEALATNSASNRQRVIEALQEKRTRSTLIICYDNDDAGKRAAAELARGLRELNIPYTEANICGEHKDPNEALTADRATFTAAVQAAERGTSKPDNTADYIRHSMAAEVAHLKAQSDRKTGFANLDAEAGSIYAGLYAVGGISSVGKTTFVSQLGDQMAAQGQHVLIFSMEQSRLEMVSKSIARQTAINDTSNAVTSLQIRTGAQGAAISKAIADYTASVGDRVSIIEGNFNCTVSFISDYTRQYMARNEGVQPVLIIDYLQVLQADKDPDTGRKTTDTKQTVDRNVTELKRLSRSLDVPIFVISSVNRSNYLAPIDFEAFKESGGIEFTADVVWGLQLAVIHDPMFTDNKDKDIIKKREKIAAAKDAAEREIELVCLKNRYGKSRYTAQFTYYPKYDYFTPKDGYTRHFGKTPFTDAPARSL